MTTVNKYRIYCTTDNKWEESWSETSPTVCPVNNTHTVNSNSVQELDTISEQLVEIKEKQANIYGSFRTETHKINASTGTNINSYTWPYPISVLNISFRTSETHRGDVVNNIIGPETIIGILSTGAQTGATGISVSQTVIDNIHNGYCIHINNDKIGECSSKNTINNIVYLADPLVASYNVNSYVKQSVYIVKEFEISEPGDYDIGKTKIGGSYLPAGVASQVNYTNNGTGAKEIIFTLEFLY